MTTEKSLSWQKVFVTSAVCHDDFCRRNVTVTFVGNVIRMRADVALVGQWNPEENDHHDQRPPR